MNEFNYNYHGKIVHDDNTYQDRCTCMIIDYGDRRREGAVQCVGSHEAPD